MDDTKPYDAGQRWLVSMTEKPSPGSHTDSTHGVRPVGAILTKKYDVPYNCKSDYRPFSSLEKITVSSENCHKGRWVCLKGLKK